MLNCYYVSCFVYSIKSQNICWLVEENVEVDLETKSKKTIAKLNGLVRGLSIIKDIAIIGISKVREKSTTFGKLDESVKAEYASIEFIDLKSGMGLGRITFKNTIQEIYDVQLLENITNVGVFGMYDDRHKQGISTQIMCSGEKK